MAGMNGDTTTLGMTLQEEETLLTKDFMEFPEELNIKCSREEFHKIMTSHNSDIPIERVNFLDYPDN
jgi:hypothetical protein